MMQGYIKVYRKMMNSAIWQDPDMFRLWMYCLMKASHKEHSVIVEKQEVKLQIGEFVTGRFRLHQEFNSGIPPRKQVKDTTLWSWLKKLEQMGNIDIKSYNKYSVVSIVNWSEYQGSLTTEPQQNDNEMTAESQQTDTYKNGKNGKKKDSRQKQVYDETTIYFKLASMLYEGILKNMPDKKKPNLNQWADDFRKLIEIDGKDPKHIETVIHWTQSNDFWWKNVLSANKLRSQYERLVAEVRADMMKHKNVTPLEAKQPKRNDAHIEKMKKLHGG
jgi:hypothetical protein